MKQLLVGIGGVILANAAFAQVLVLGGAEVVPVAQPVAYAEPVAYQAQTPTTIVVQGPVVIQQIPAAYGTAVPPCGSAAPTVIYVSGPGGCANDYYRPGRCGTPNVVYFGRMQACQQGYNFTHRR